MHTSLKTTHALLFCLAVCLIKNVAYSQPASTLHSQSIIDSGMMPQVFAPGVISTPFSEWSTSFTPGAKTVYSSQGAVYWTVVYSNMNNGKWMKPQIAPFSGKWRDTDPFVSPDGKKLFFSSDRPLEGTPQDKPQKAFHLWYVELTAGDEWGAPRHIDSVVNENGKGNYAPSVSQRGTLYFCSRNRDGDSGMNSYCAEWLGDHYARPILVRFSGLSESQDPFIAPDERYIVFLSGSDLYISYRNGKEWGVPENLGPEVNDGSGNSSPYISADEKTMYYSSARIKGFYKRDYTKPALNYDELAKEAGGLFNSDGNILMIPIHIKKAVQ